MGPPSTEPSSKNRNRNNVEVLARFLNERYFQHYLVWNLSDDLGTKVAIYRQLHCQICDFRWAAPGKSQTPCLDTLVRICYSIKVEESDSWGG